MKGAGAIRYPVMFIQIIAVALAVVPVRAQSVVAIPDTSFRNFLNANYPTFMDATGESLYTDSAATVTGSFVCANQNIDDITGLEWFHNVQWLYCYGNNLTSLPDLSAFTNLKWLHCYDNQLDSLPDLSASTGIQQLRCENNNLTRLPALSSPNFTLQRLYCEYNQLTVLPDLSRHMALERLYCNDNRLDSLPDLSYTLLERLYCWRNNLTALPPLPNSLTNLGCDQNDLTALPDLTGFTSLVELYCGANQLTSLPDLSTLSALTSFDCRTNRLDFSDARELLIIDNLPALTLFMYESQAAFGQADSMDLSEGDTLTLRIAFQDSATGYQWFKGTDTLAGATDTLLVIPGVSLADSGTYTCRSYGSALLYPPMNFSPGISEFVSEGVTVTVSADVPVTLVSFASAVTGGGVLLSWSTASERDCLGFNVLRSTNEDGPFKRVNPALIPGAGSVSGIHEYYFTDTGVSAGTWYYCLEQVDTDGGTTLSGIIPAETGITGMVSDCTDPVRRGIRKTRYDMTGTPVSGYARGIYIVREPGGLTKILKIE